MWNCIRKARETEYVHTECENVRHKVAMISSDFFCETFPRKTK